MNSSFDIPVVLYLFKRKDTVLKILKVLSKIKPTKLYLLSDGGRDDKEIQCVNECREIIESAIDWDCEVIKKYHQKNVGVYDNIGLGAKWVLSQEDMAIFLEDDNLPEETSPSDGSSYFFSKNMLPCGWASWGDKFTKYYDGELLLWQSEYLKNRIKDEYVLEDLYEQDSYNIEYEIEHKQNKGRFYSWDYQMSFSIRVHNLYGIIPKYNQIKNIGVDDNSTHGGNSLNNVMVERFCERKTKRLEFPLKHPEVVLLDLPLEKKLAEIILDPSFNSFKSKLSRKIRHKFKIEKTVSIRDSFVNYFNEKK